MLWNVSFFAEQLDNLTQSISLGAAITHVPQTSVRTGTIWYIFSLLLNVISVRLGSLSGMKRLAAPTNVWSMSNLDPNLKSQNVRAKPSLILFEPEQKCLTASRKTYEPSQKSLNKRLPRL